MNAIILKIGLWIFEKLAMWLKDHVTGERKAVSVVAWWDGANSELKVKIVRHEPEWSASRIAAQAWKRHLLDPTPTHDNSGWAYKDAPTEPPFEKQIAFGVQTYSKTPRQLVNGFSRYSVLVERVTDGD